ncbi:MAG: aminotransferase DegT [Robiginitomaculum sp.]|nr:MAG: aminotransferase DegT [Robiginitomaculum sp.]
MRFPFIDLQAQRNRIADEVEAAMLKVLRSGAYILGPEVAEFEQKIAKFLNTEHALACANGTDALILPMMAWNIGAGDAVFCPSFTYTASAESVAVLGAAPVFVDVDEDTYTLCPKSLEAAITTVKREGKLTPRAVMAIDLFGQSADYPAIKTICEREGLKLISDCAQGLGCTLNGNSPAHWADVVTTSFFPAKPLGCYGDGGCVFTNDIELAETMRSLAFHGRATQAYDHDRIGINSRLDTLQAAILLEKLKIFPDEIKSRTTIAERYSRYLSPLGLKTPTLIENSVSTWAQYTVEVENRDAFMDAVKAQGIPVAAYYPRPVHLQSAYKAYPVAGNGLPITEKIMKSVVSLPMHPYLTPPDQDEIIAVIKQIINQL